VRAEPVNLQNPAAFRTAFVHWLGANDAALAPFRARRPGPIEDAFAHDNQLVNLQTKFLITNVKGTEREWPLPVNVDIDQLPFIRPPFPWGIPLPFWKKTLDRYYITIAVEENDQYRVGDVKVTGAKQFNEAIMRRSNTYSVMI